MDRIARARLTACALTILGIAGGHGLRAGVPAPDGEIRLGAVTRTVGGREARDVAVSDRVRQELRSDALLMRCYEVEAAPPVWLFVDYHREQRLGATIHSPRACYPGAGWNVRSVEIAAMPIAETSHPVRWLHLERGEEEMAAAYWYETRWGRSAREVELKLDIVRSAFARRVSDAALVRVSTPVRDGNREEARQRLLDFLAELHEPLRSELPFSEARS